MGMQSLRLGCRNCFVVCRCGGCGHILYCQSTRQADIGVQLQTLCTELFLSVALKYIPPGSSSQNVWDGFFGS
jgi:hypothetical protein